MSPRARKVEMMISTSVIAARLSISNDTVLRWIRDGELEAVDVRRRASGRPTYRVRITSFEALLRRRGASDDVIRDVASCA